MSFCKNVFHILWLSLEINSVYDVAVWLTTYCIFKKKKKKKKYYHVCLIVYRSSQDANYDVFMFQYASVNRRKKKKSFWRYRKAVAKNIWLSWSFISRLLVFWFPWQQSNGRLFCTKFLHFIENCSWKLFWLNFVETYWIVWPKSPFLW